jgi:poly-gamma-glutamate capsule biosynthesis protein CapA/YwtB (metallophosphatase superfamily)
MPMSRRAGNSKECREHKRPSTRLALLVFFVSFVVVAWLPTSGKAAPDLSAYPWLYLRDGELLAAGEQVVAVIAVGDVMLGRSVIDEARPLAAVAPWLRAADLVLGNLECVIAQEGTPRSGPYRLRAPLSAVADLRDAGFDVLGLANNHALDYGSAGLAETILWLHEAGLDAIGAGPDAEAASQPVVREVGGVRLAFLAFNAVSDPADRSKDKGWTRSMWDRDRAVTAIAAARAEAAAVIASIHWGYEYQLRPDPAQRDAAQAMLDAGADLVIGHHPHVVQGTELDFRRISTISEVSGAGFVAYSLGNLIFDQQQDETRQGLALRAFFDRQGLRAVQALPLWAGPRPRLMGLDEAAALLARVRPLLRHTGFACNGGTCSPVDVPPTSETGLFHAGALDLTGDGVAELVRLVDKQVVVYQDGLESWRGLPEWRVVDLALGDPNDDGRGELLLALWKPDVQGVLRSHPFIVGYREGAYRILWGGSASTDPIREVELGDVDGDGVHELVVLEERGDSRAVGIWRWHGWGFSLVWRSPPGHYRDLVPPVISVARLP